MTLSPVQSLFWHLEKNITVDAFLEVFPTVNRKQAEAVLKWTAEHFEFPESIMDETITG